MPDELILVQEVFKTSICQYAFLSSTSGRIRHGQHKNMSSNYGIQACSYVEAVRQIASNDSEKTFANVSLVKPSNDQGFALERAFASNTTLKVLHVTTNGCGSSVVMELCRGLRANKSIETVLWIMTPSDRTVAHASAIHDWVKLTGTLRSLCIQRLQGYPGPARLANGAHKPTIRSSVSGTPCDNAFAQTVFQALTSNKSLCKFRLESYAALSNETKEAFYSAVDKNESLVDVFIEFHERDYRLALLTAFNCGRWKRRFTPTTLPDEPSSLLSPKSLAERVVAVLEEVAGMNEIAALAASYELFRRNPDILLQL
jgi:hypothetical protein